MPNLLSPRASYSPFEYPRAHEFWTLQQQSHWLHCVGPDERVFTSKGLRTVKELFESKEPLQLHNGSEWVESTPMLKTGYRELFKLQTKEGFTHTVTADHRVMTPTGWVEAHHLKPGDLVTVNTTEVNCGDSDDPDLAFLVGHYQGDGTQTDSTIIFDVWQHENHLKPFIEAALARTYTRHNLDDARYATPTFNKGNDVHARSTSNKLSRLGVFVKGVIPEFVWRGNVATRYAYLKGLFYTDGTTYQNTKHESIKFSQVGKMFVCDVQTLMLSLGIKSTMYCRPSTSKLLPDGKGGKKLYPCQDLYTLEITQKSCVAKLDAAVQMFAHRGRVFRGFKNPRKAHPITHARFESLTSIGFSDVYCVSVFKDYKAWVCNGFVTHNTEISMASDINDWKQTLSDSERKLVGSILKGFVQSEVFIQEYWSSVVAKWFKKPEIQLMSAVFASFESIHAVSYAYLNQSLGLEDFDAFLHEPAAKAKIDRLIETKGKSKREIARSLAVFSAFNEGVNLFSSFAVLLNFSRFNKLKGVGQIIAFSIKDESLHSEAGCWLFRTLIEENPDIWDDELKKEIYEAARVTVALEDDFLEKAFSEGAVEGLTLEDMKAFIRHRCNVKLQDLGLKKNWKSVDKDALQRMAWFDAFSGHSHTDFFAQRVSDYAKGVQNWDEIF